MFYHALTGNGGTEPVLLWTNPNTATEFGPQKISVDLSNSKGVIVEFMLSNSNQLVKSRQLIYKGEQLFGAGYTAGANGTSRNITAVEDDGVTFENAVGGSVVSNGLLIPYKIYAIN